ncbi:MAG: CPBP family intramembrane glutamic endopeptidase [Planctomycetota bacterium]
MSPRLSAALILLLLLPAPSIGVAAALWWWPEQPLGQTLFALCKVWLLALPLLWYRLVERGSWSLSPMRRGGFRMGMFTGIGIAVVIVLVYVLARPWLDLSALQARLAAIGLDTPGRLLVMAAYWTFINSVLEEYVWRWFVVRQWIRLLPAAGAIVAAALAFTVHHVIALRLYFDWPLALLASAGVCAGGLIWSWMYWRYASIWPGWISHAWADLAIFGIALTWVL